MMRRKRHVAAIVLAASVTILAAWSSPSDAQAIEERVKLYDVSADVLPQGQGQLGLFWANYARGIVPGVQLSSHLAGDLVGVFNLSAKFALLQAPELRLSAEVGAVWPLSLEGFSRALGPGQTLRALLFPAALRATTPLWDDIELNVAWHADATLVVMNGMEQGGLGIRSELTLVRYDSRGAFLLTGRFPLLMRSTMQVQAYGSALGGALTLDELDSWGVLVARDHIFGETAHVRLGLGYRHKPGIVLVQSIGHVLLEFDVYWR